MIEREELLEKITKKLTRDDGEKFYETERLDYIKTVLKDSAYEIFEETGLVVIYKKKNADLPEKVVLISSHVDCVDGITIPNFKLTKKGNYKGTFDNAATNAAVVIAMLENRFEDNVVIAFTGDEEENQEGAKQAIEYLQVREKKVVAIALDVTFDLESEKEDYTTYKNASYTIDNLCLNTDEQIVRSLFDIAKNLGVPFMVTRADDEADKDEYGNWIGYDYFSGENENKTGDYYEAFREVEECAAQDEAIEYSKYDNCIGTFSLCLPTDDDSDTNPPTMHTNELIKIKKKSFTEYIEAVTHISNGLAIL